MSEEWSFEKDDFLTTTPYEALYAYHKEPFTHAAKMEELAAYSVSKGFKGFKTMYKKYVESLKAQSGTIYIDNVTNFTNQPLELNAGDWEADDSGIFKKKRRGHHQGAQAFQGEYEGLPGKGGRGQEGGGVHGCLCHQ